MTAAKAAARLLQQQFLVLKMIGEKTAEPVKLKFERGRRRFRDLVAAGDDGFVIGIDRIVSDTEMPDCPAPFA